jgi:hypothetical protein
VNKILKTIYAQDNPWGTVAPPDAFKDNIREGGGLLFVYINNFIKVIIVVAGMFVLFNFITAGYTFITSGGNPDKVEEAWTKIWHSFLGLAVIASSFILAGIAGQLLFDNPTYFLQFRIWTP